MPWLAYTTWWWVGLLICILVILLATIVLTLFAYNYGRQNTLHRLGLELSRMNQCPLCLSQVHSSDFRRDELRGKSARQYVRRLAYGIPDWLGDRDELL